MHLPAGEYGVRITDRGRATVYRKVTLQGNQATVLSETLTALSGVAFNITDAGGNSIPCKVQFSGQRHGAPQSRPSKPRTRLRGSMALGDGQV